MPKLLSKLLLCCQLSILKVIQMIITIPDYGPKKRRKGESVVRVRKDRVPETFTSIADSEMSLKGKPFASMQSPLMLGLPAELSQFTYQGRDGRSFKELVALYGRGLREAQRQARGDDEVLLAYLNYYGLNQGVTNLRHLAYLKKLIGSVEA